MAPRKKLLIVAGSRPDLARIPAELEQRVTVEVVCAEKGVPGTRCLHNPHEPGRGGDQKIAFAYALARGVDLVAVASSERALGELPRLCAPVLDGEADAVLGVPLRRGSRLHRVLPTVMASAVSLARVYSADALRRVPFRLGSSGDGFDTDLVVQLFDAGLRILAVPVPSAPPVVPDARAVANALRTMLRYRLHGMGLLYQRRFDTTPDNLQYDLKLGYASSHTYALDAVPAGAAVLDIGSGPGGMARELLSKGCTVAVVDQFAPEHPDPRVMAFTHDLEDLSPLDVNRYDYLLLLDVIEHMKDPERFLDELRSRFDDRPKTLILTTPNIAFIVQRLMLLLGQFNYGKTGILDRTHTRLFTFRTIERLLREAGFRIKTIRGVPAPFPKVLGKGRLGRAAIAANQALIGLSKTLFSYQVYVEAEATPDVDFVLREILKEPVPARSSGPLDATPRRT